jgi:hypothetical protein
VRRSLSVRSETDETEASFFSSHTSETVGFVLLFSFAENSRFHSQNKNENVAKKTQQKGGKAKTKSKIQKLV